MGFEIKRPTEVRRSFALDSKVRVLRPMSPIEFSPGKRYPKKRTAGGTWPKGRMDYEFFERCKEIICRIKHPNLYFQHRETEYRFSKIQWSRGCYFDLRKYKFGKPSGEGILLHQDIWEVLLSEVIAAVRQAQFDDTREKEQKQGVEVIPV